MKISMNPTIKDLKIVQYFKETKDPSSLGLLYRRYSKKVYMKCLSILQNECRAQDATQDIFIQVFLKLPSFRQEARFSTWLFSITRNFCIDLLRKKHHQKVNFSDDLESIYYLPEEFADYELREKQFTELDQVLRLIPRDDQQILLMKFRDQMSIKAIAQSKAISEGSVKMRLFRAKARARSLRLQLAG